jgi:hypothetical protein
MPLHTSEKTDPGMLPQLGVLVPLTTQVTQAAPIGVCEHRFGWMLPASSTPGASGTLWVSQLAGRTPGLRSLARVPTKSPSRITLQRGTRI